MVRVGAWGAAALALAAWADAPSTARAFCGFYVSGADGSLYANATMVVLMREGTRTVLSMQNDYQGPPEDFAMVVPVPTVLEEADVRTLPKEIFGKVDQLAAPRLVEYWEQDPCFQPRYEVMESAALPMAARSSMADEAPASADLGVTIEAQFTVGEYEIVILSARDSSGLDTWLRRERYRIPEGAERVLRPYVEQGTKFFVAKVDVEKVRFEGGKAVLSPLRVHYDANDFVLPVRLGLLNSAGTQDLIVHVLAQNRRYEVANYPNAFIPTNQVVPDSVRDGFGRWYEGLFQQTVARHPGAVVTEYAWDASSCDPCPTPPLDGSELATLGADVLPGSNAFGFTLTRLHYRYDADGLGEDLVFRAANGVVGGRGMPDANGRLSEQQAAPTGYNNFQGRYVMLHWWEGPLACSDPVRGRWGGPPGGVVPQPIAAVSPLRAGLGAAVPAPDVGAPAGGEELGGGGGEGGAPPPAAGGGCAGCAVDGRDPRGAVGAGLLLALTALGVVARRRARRGA